MRVSPLGGPDGAGVAREHWPDRGAHGQHRRGTIGKAPFWPDLWGTDCFSWQWEYRACGRTVVDEGVALGLDLEVDLHALAVYKPMLLRRGTCRKRAVATCDVVCDAVFNPTV